MANLLQYQPTNKYVSSLNELSKKLEISIQSNPMDIGYTIQNFGKTHIMIGLPHECKLIAPGETGRIRESLNNDVPRVTRLAQ